jgi:hypothetical protein
VNFSPLKQQTFATIFIEIEEQNHLINNYVGMCIRKIWLVSVLGMGTFFKRIFQRRKMPIPGSFSSSPSIPVLSSVFPDIAKSPLGTGGLQLFGLKNVGEFQAFEYILQCQTENVNTIEKGFQIKKSAFTFGFEPFPEPRLDVN